MIEISTDFVPGSFPNSRHFFLLY